MAIDRKALQRRASRQAARTTAAKRARLGAEKKATQRNYRTEVGASKGASKVTRSAIKSALGGLEDDYGLSGSTLRSTRQELRGQIGDAKNMVPFEKASLQAERDDALAGFSDDEFAIDEAEKAKQESLYHAAVTKQKAKQADLREAQKSKAKNKTERDHDFKAGVKQALTEIRVQVANGSGPGPDAQQNEREMLRASPVDRKALADYLVASQDIDRRAANRAVALYAKRNNDPDRVRRDAMMKTYQNFFGLGGEDDK